MPPHDTLTSCKLSDSHDVAKMARTNVDSRSEDHNMPPPSTMAAHIKKGGKPSEMNATTFSQLLKETLRPTATHEDGVVADVPFNSALLISVLNIGIAPHVAPAGKHIPKNPLQKRLDPGENNIILRQSLQVATLIINKTRQVIYHDGLCECQPECKDTPAYACILPLIAALVVQYQDESIISLGGDLLRTCLEGDKKCPCGCCGNITGVLTGLSLRIAREALNAGSDIAISYNTVVPHSTSGETLEHYLKHVKPSDPKHYIRAGLFLIQHCFDRAIPRTVGLQLKKCLKLLENAAQACDDTADVDLAIEAAKQQLASLKLIRSFKPSIIEPNGHSLPASKRPHKRIRLSADSDVTMEDPEISFKPTIIHNLTNLLTGTAVSDLDSLVRDSPPHFRRLDDDKKRCAAIHALGIASCQLATESILPDCPICDDPCGSIFDAVPQSRFEEADKMLAALDVIRLKAERTPAGRLSVLHAYRRILNHVQDHQKLRLRETLAGEFTLNMLLFPSRDIRLAAAQALQSFVRPVLHEASPTIQANRKLVLDRLQSIWKAGKVIPQEGMIIALRNIGEVTGDQELGTVVSLLVESLGNTNLYISGLAAAELVQLAQNLRTNMQGLLRPYWRILGVVVARTLRSRPYLAQQLCELLGMQFNGLAKLIEESALPQFVLHEQNDLIERFASSNNSPTTLFELCSSKIILPRILSLLLMQGYEDPEEAIMQKLTHVSEEFGNSSLGIWLSLNHSAIACELLKMMHTASMQAGSHVYAGLQVLAQLSYRKSTSGAAPRKADAVAMFLESNMWAVVTEFTREFDDNTTREVKGERRRCLFGLGQLARLARHRIENVKPQICALLRTALADLELCDAAFQSWMMMVISLDEDTVESLFAQTFVITSKYWSVLSAESRSMAENGITHLFKKYRPRLEKEANKLPSLAGVSELSIFEDQLKEWRKSDKGLGHLQIYVELLADEVSIVAENTMSQLLVLLRKQSQSLHSTLSQEQPHPVIAPLIRAILDCVVKHNDNEQLLLDAAQCLGCIGKVDSSRVDDVREKKSMVLISNFSVSSETIQFLMFFMEQVVVPEYLSASTLRSKTFLGWALQKLLRACNITHEITLRTRLSESELGIREKLWAELSDTARLVLTPFTSSTFVAPNNKPIGDVSYPLIKRGMDYDTWLTHFTLDMLSKSSAPNTKTIFEICSKMVQYSPGTAVAEFIMPYTLLNLLINGTESEKKQLGQEFSAVLSFDTDAADLKLQETVRRCSQAVFDALDYLSKWLQEKRKWLTNATNRADRGVRDPALDSAPSQIESVEALIKAIPPKVITRRSIECHSYARALQHWDEHIKRQESPTDEDYQTLQKIYAEIDEPDGIEGISSRMQVLNAESQIMEHRKAGRWQAVQNWYEMQLTNNPDNSACQLNLLHALRESGQHDMLLHQYGGIAQATTQVNPQCLQYAIEASWSTGQLVSLQSLLTSSNQADFTGILGRNLLQLQQNNPSVIRSGLEELCLVSVKDLTFNSTTSISGCDQSLLRTHVAEDLRFMAAASGEDKSQVIDLLKRRTDALGTDVMAKQYVLGVQRAAMLVRPEIFTNQDLSSSWLATAKLARKAHEYPRALDAVLRAEALGNTGVVFEKTKLMWLEGRHRKAIKTLESAINSGIFNSHAYTAANDSFYTKAETQTQNHILAKAHVLHGRWLDQSGQSSSDQIRVAFGAATRLNGLLHTAWYRLGQHYNRALESEKGHPPHKQSDVYLSGQLARSVIENFLRAISVGSKYVFESLPKFLTLWLELASNPDIETDARRGTNEFHRQMVMKRKKAISEVHGKIKKYIGIVPSFMFYTILPQLVARICHTTKEVHEILEEIIVKVVHDYPKQALWTVTAVQKSVDKNRGRRGLAIITKLLEVQRKRDAAMNASDLRSLIVSAQKLTQELIRVADFNIEGKISRIKLHQHLQFDHRVAPTQMVVPVESCLIPNISPRLDSVSIKSVRVFSTEPTTITAFTDDASVLPSLQKPRKLNIRGSDGKMYAILAKPKDDLRKDQRLMEFDTMINRFLKRDIEASKRRLYIRTYAVVPLNEECGVVEWVNSLTTMRDILIRLYKERDIAIDYQKVRAALDDICLKSTNKGKDYEQRIAPLFPSVLRYWFAETFAGPDAWLNARIRYTRSTAVMSMVGHILGLGDRHGENILFEEDNGGIMHVDFNCLFDKGLTFDKPETVPFRLTANMVDAFGVFGVEGPYRRCCEITMELLRNHTDGLMTVLETFLHDPTTDFQTTGKRRGKKDLDALVPDTAEKMLEGVKGKVRGMIQGESVPLSVGGYVDEMIRRATDPKLLVQMYIGWCAFL